MHDGHSELCDHVRLLKGICRPRDSFLVRSDTLFNLISEMDALEDDQRYFGGRSLHARSHGEGILALVSRRFGGEGFYVLDEPRRGSRNWGRWRFWPRSCGWPTRGRSWSWHALPHPALAPGAVIYQFEDEVRRVGLEQTMEWDASTASWKTPTACSRNS